MAGKARLKLTVDASDLHEAIDRLEALAADGLALADVRLAAEAVNQADAANAQEILDQEILRETLKKQLLAAVTIIGQMAERLTPVYLGTQNKFVHSYEISGNIGDAWLLEAKEWLDEVGQPPKC